MRFALLVGMSDSLRQRILAVRDKDGADPRFADRLLEGLRRIEIEFRGSERERLRTLVSETLDRHLEIRRNSARTRRALAKLQADQAQIAEQLRLLFSPPSNRTLH